MIEQCTVYTTAYNVFTICTFIHEHQQIDTIFGIKHFC